MDSASGGMKDARDNEFQAILPIRGKILNVQKAPLEKILANAEIVAMINTFGLQLDPKSKKITFDVNNLRYGKIIIAADADIDGSHIQSLFYTFIWKYAPELFQQGYIYASIPPLYRITMSNKYLYLKDDKALEEFKQQHLGKKYIITRNKGLGEQDAEELEETILNPKTRTLKKIQVSDIQTTDSLFNKLMGDNVTERKKYIEQHSNKKEVNI